MPQETMPAPDILLTRAAGTRTMGMMSHRWFIPASLGVFLLVVAGLWLYLSATTGTHDIQADAHRSLLDDPDFLGLVWTTPPPRNRFPFAPSSDSPSKRLAKTPRTRTPRLAQRAGAAASPPAMSFQQMAASLAARIDESSVRMRTAAAKSAVGRYIEGMKHLKAGRPERALACFNEMLARDADNQAALAARAGALIQLHRFDEAANAFADLIRVVPDDADVRYNYAVVLYRLFRFREAASELREAVALNPDHAAAQYNLASLAQRDGRLTEARDAWEAFTRLQPNVAGAWFNLGIIYLDFDEPLRAAHAFHAAVTVEPLDADAHLNLGIAWAAAGEFGVALAEMTRADRLAPCDTAITSRLAELRQYLAMSETGEAAPDPHDQMAGAPADQVESLAEQP